MNQSISKRIQKELTIIKEDPELGIKLISPTGEINPEDLNNWVVSIKGPVDTPYEGGTFYLTVNIPPEYPFSPPKIKFNTKIYHPNINGIGEICLDTLKGSWAPSLTIQKTLLSIISLLSSPNPDDPLIVEIAKIYKENYEEYAKIAREFTKKYA